MALRPFRSVPTNLIEWSRYLETLEINPDPGSVDDDAIEDGAVTYQKIQNVTPDRLLGRDTSPAGQVQELTVTGGLEFTGTGIQRSALTGDITASAGSATTALRNAVACSVIGRSANSTGAPADIQAATNGHFFRRSGDVLGFAAIADADIPSTIARDTEVTTAISNHEAAGDPHPGYLTQAEGDARYALYEEGTFTATGTGFSGTVQVTAYYVKCGDAATIFFPQIVGTSNATTMTITGIPAGLQPARTQGYLCVPMNDNTAISSSPGLVRMNTDGTMTCWPTVNGSSSGFTNSGTKGPDNFNYSYVLS
jgi:hypothetical protein